MKFDDKILIGLSEKVIIYGKKDKKELKARIDTGATKSSMDIKLYKELGLGPIIKKKLVKSAHGSQRRPVINAEVKLVGKKMKAEFTLADRIHMRYKCLIGQNILKYGFLIDPSIK